MKLGSRSAVRCGLVVVIGMFLLSTAGMTSAQNITALEVRVEVLEVEVENMEDDINDVETDVDHQDTRITVVEVASLQHTNDIADLTLNVEDTEDAMVLLQQRMSALEAANNLLQEQVGVLENTVTEQEETIAVLESTIETLQLADNATDIRFDSVESDLLDTTLRLTSVEEEVTGHDTELGTLTETMEVLEETVDDVEDAMTLMETQNQDLQERLTTVEEIVIVPWVACGSSPCDNGGTCIDVNIDTFICMCRDGYYGDTCQFTPTEACSSSLCENDGTCVDINVETAVCMCRDGYFGLTCNQTPTEACSSSPCQNGGTCVDVNVDAAICMCRDGYFGLTCDQSYSDTPFLATFDVGTLTPSDPIVFDYPVLNPGGHYDVTSGIYTVPLDGTYEFIVHILGYDDYDIRARLVVDDQVVTYTWAYGSATYDYRLLESVVVLPLTAGQQVWVAPNTISSMYGAYSDGMRSWFSAHLIHAV